MKRYTWIGLAAWLGLVGGALALAGTGRAEGPEQPRFIAFFEDDAAAEEAAEGEEGAGDEERETVSAFWIGLALDESIDETLRAQLGLTADQGLIISSVAEDSPAAKAGLQEHDIVVAAGGKPIGKHADLVAAVQEAGEKELAVEVIRAGEKTTIQVMPEKRPAQQALEARIGADGEQMRLWFDKWRAGEDGLAFVVPRPGIVLPQRLPWTTALPDGMSVTVTKEGDSPTKIMVKRGEESWETTEDKLGELPDDVRGPVQMFLGRLPFAIAVHPPATAPVPLPRSIPEGRVQERQLERLQRQVEKLQQALEELSKQLGKPEGGEEQ
jgi:hypothetical protein